MTSARVCFGVEPACCRNRHASTICGRLARTERVVGRLTVAYGSGALVRAAEAVAAGSVTALGVLLAGPELCLAYRGLCRSTAVARGRGEVRRAPAVTNSAEARGVAEVRARLASAEVHFAGVRLAELRVLLLEDRDRGHGRVLRSDLREDLGQDCVDRVGTVSSVL